MSNTNIPNMVGYEGFVKVELQPGIRGRRIYKYKNAGTPLFFKYLSQCICGYDVRKYMPTYIQLVRKVTDETTALTEYVRLSGKVWGRPANPDTQDNDSGWASFNSIITSSDKISGKITSDDEFLTLVNEDKEILAEVQVTDLYGSITSTSDALVTWLIRIGQSSSSGG